MGMMLYSALLTLVILVLGLRSAVSMGRNPDHRESLNQRFGHVAQALRAAVAGKRVIWVHAVSVGELLASSRLVQELEGALGPGWIVVISTTTATGQALARQRFGADRVFYFPFDFAFSMRAVLRALQPQAVVLMESEIWPRMLHETSKRQIPVAVVNAHVSDRSFQRSHKVRWIWSRVLRQTSLWLAQSPEDARRLVAMGARPETVKVGGNLKYDVRAPKESRVAALIRKLATGRPVVVAGSTTKAVSDNGQEDEEKTIVDLWTKVRSVHPEALLVLAPRHPERFDQAMAYMQTLRTVRATRLLEMADDGEASSPIDAVCLDTIGDLARVYEIADVAFVGGSLVPHHGHNPLEPAQFGVPVVIGPSYENFRDIVEKMKTADAIRILDRPIELESVLLSFLENRDSALAIGERGRQVFEEQQGATTRAVNAILQMVKQ